MRGGAWICVFTPLTLACSGGAGEAGGDAGAGEGSASVDGSSPSPLDAAAGDGEPAEATAPTGSCPAGMAVVTAEAGVVCVDLYEGALVRREADGGETAWPHYEPIDAYDAGEFRAVPAAAIYPQGYISGLQADAACRASGKRLCTLEEWTSACRDRPAHDYVYPYGDAYQPGWCNEGKESPIVILFGPNPTYSEAELNDPRCDQLDGGLARGGDYARCASKYGPLDMHGNLHEWIDDTPDPAAPDRGSFMGGYFVDATLNGAGCTYRTTAHAKSYHDYSTGFRCCADAH